MDDYKRAQFLQIMKKLSEEKPRHLGLADETCPVCGGPIVTLLDSNMRNPERRCWRCTKEE